MSNRALTETNFNVPEKLNETFIYSLKPKIVYK